MIKYKRIFEENVNAQKHVYERFKENFEIRKQKLENSNHPVDPSGQSTNRTKPH